MAKLIVRGSALIFLIAVLLSTACAQLAPPKMEYRAGLALYSNPKFSFQLPEGWRPATSADWMHFTINPQYLQTLTPQARRNFEPAGETVMARVAAAFIHTTGAFLAVTPSERKPAGSTLPKGYRPSDEEQDRIWKRF